MFYHVSKVTKPSSKKKTIRLLDLGFEQTVPFLGQDYVRVPYEYDKHNEPVYRFKAIESGSIMDFRIVHGRVYVMWYLTDGLAEHAVYAPDSFGIFKRSSYYCIDIVEDKQKGRVDMLPFKNGDNICGDWFVDVVSNDYLVAREGRGKNTAYANRMGGPLGIVFIQEDDPNYVFTRTDEVLRCLQL